MARKTLSNDEIAALLAGMEEEHQLEETVEEEIEEEEFIEESGGIIEGPRHKDDDSSDDDDDARDDYHPLDEDDLSLEDDVDPDDVAPVEEGAHIDAPIDAPSTSATLTPVEERSRRRRRGELQPPTGTPIEKLGVPEVQGRDGTTWYRDPQPGLPLIEPVRVEKGSPTEEVINSGATQVSDYISLFLDDEMLAEVVEYTNQRLRILREGLGGVKYMHTLIDLDLMELKGLIGLFIMSGTCRNNHVAVRELWDNQEGAPVFKSSMGINRFNVLCRVLRFDDLTTRPERARSDKFAPMRSFWDKFIQKCRANYGPGPHMTVDEQLVPFRGRCPFKMYIPSKPSK